MMALYLLLKLTAAAVLLCAAPAGGYIFQGLYECEYGEDVADMVFIVKNVFNQKLNTMYDSRVGKYVGYDEYGLINADHYNHQDWKMIQRRTQVETVCRYNARLFRQSTLDRKVPPTVRVRQTKPAGYGERTMLECSVWGFYPQEVRVSWLRDEVDVTTDVSSTDVLPNGDWSFQLHSYLELTLRRGERVSCLVDHSSLRESLVVDWDHSILDAKHLKMTVGVIFFFFGFTVATGGAVYYWRKQRFDFSPLGRRGPASPCDVAEL